MGANTLCIGRCECRVCLTHSCDFRCYWFVLCYRSFFTPWEGDNTDGNATGA
ncbi:hypothetical protein GCM10022255_108730 [Dactylosporangium darangshiense]|uniref:Uncharacterized protein n=1 Tax=Dactylosporangium darangshiense TaxID=579108 RepID=A0ABP8DUI0_9ACTN